MTTATHPSSTLASAVSSVVPFVHVASVDSSLAFYALLGFAPLTVLKDPRGRAFWAMAQSGEGKIMFSQSSGPIDAAQQAVLFYMYSTDVAALRQHLLAGGLRDAGTYTGAATPSDGPRTVFAISRPAHMPAGEIRIADPDGYVILIGQLN